MLYTGNSPLLEGQQEGGNKRTQTSCSSERPEMSCLTIVGLKLSIHVYDSIAATSSYTVSTVNQGKRGRLVMQDDAAELAPGGI